MLIFAIGKLDLAKREREQAESELRAFEPTEPRDANQQLDEVGHTVADARAN